METAVLDWLENNAKGTNLRMFSLDAIIFPTIFNPSLILPGDVKSDYTLHIINLLLDVLI